MPHDDLKTTVVDDGTIKLWRLGKMSELIRILWYVVGPNPSGLIPIKVL